MQYSLATGLLFVLLFSAVFSAPSVIVNAPNGGEIITQLNGDTNIDFNVTSAEGDPNVSIYYDEDGAWPAGSSTIIYDQNLLALGICADNNFDDSTNCIYSWDSTGVNGSKYIVILIENGTTPGMDVSDAAAMVDNNAPLITSLNPADDSWVNNSQEVIHFTTLELESDVNTFSLVLQVDGNTYVITDSQVDYNSAIQTFFFTPDYNYSEGVVINIIVDIDDNAGNSATTASWSFKADYTDPGASIDDDIISTSWVQINSITVSCDYASGKAGAPCDSNKLYYFAEVGGGMFFNENRLY